MVSKDDLLKISSFNKEKDLFSLLLGIINYNKSIIYSDFNSYIIGQSNHKFPTWIWSRDNLTDLEYQLLLGDLKNHLKKGENQITCKKELYERLKEDFNVDHYFEMGFLSCKKVIKPDTNKEIFVKINYTDKVVLAEYWRGFVKEVDHKSISQKEALEDVEAMLQEDKYYVLKNSKGDILAMAGYSVIDDYAKLSHVYTPKEFRRKGYCKTIIYHLTKKLLEEGYKPILYTDYHYVASNKAYQRVGYRDKGILINFNITL